MGTQAGRPGFRRTALLLQDDCRASSRNMLLQSGCTTYIFSRSIVHDLSLAFYIMLTRASLASSSWSDFIPRPQVFGDKKEEIQKLAAHCASLCGV